MTSVFNRPEKSEVVQRMKQRLAELREQYDVPAEPQEM